MTPRAVVWALGGVLLSASAAWAGMDYPMKCSNCGYATRVQIGGGRGFGQISGFCVESQKFVYLKWNRGAKKPEPAAKVWDSTSGEMLEIYTCPECPKPFVPLRLKAANAGGPGFDHCPKCGKPTFQVEKSKGIIAFD